MLSPVFENYKYQEFLNSNERENLVSSEVYLEFFRDRNPQDILEVGCGLGYVSLYLQERLDTFLKRDLKEPLHFYPTDCQEDLLDELWRTLTEKQAKNVTPFYSPDESHFRFDGWLPTFTDSIFSFSLVALDDPALALKTVRAQMAENFAIHIIDWDKDKAMALKDEEPPVLWLRPSEMLSAAKMKYLVESLGFHIYKEYEIQGPAFAMSLSS